jgi:hypothetical protein
MQKRRLLRLADFLETVPRRQFNMKVWGNGTDPKECGFAGCAGGWATSIFPALKLIPWGFFSQTEIRYGEFTSFEALQNYFGLTYADAEYIFDSYEYPKSNRNPLPKTVADRIRKLVNSQVR